LHPLLNVELPTFVSAARRFSGAGRVLGARLQNHDWIADRSARSIALEENNMAKGYWITCYREITDPLKLAAYAKLAGPAIVSAGGRFLARGAPAKVYEGGLEQRTVVVEFESVAHAIAAHDGPAYRAALAALAGGAVRDIRIVPGAEDPA
jgi:uncharacterized protein (DUF1330 family)